MKKNECKEIYQQAFDDDDSFFEDLLFNHCYKYVEVISENEKIVSMLFLLPCNAKNNQNITLKARYIYAAATAQESRKKGYMARLLENAKKKYDLLFLRPAEKSLIGYYEKFGFKTVKAYSFSDADWKITPEEDFLELTKNLSIPKNEDEFDFMYYSKKDLDIGSVSFPYTMF